MVWKYFEIDILKGIYEFKNIFSNIYLRKYFYNSDEYFKNYL